MVARFGVVGRHLPHHDAGLRAQQRDPGPTEEGGPVGHLHVPGGQQQPHRAHVQLGRPRPQP